MKKMKSLRMKNKKGYAFLIPLLMIISLVAGILTIINYYGLDIGKYTGSLVGTAKYIERPSFAYVKCEPIGQSSDYTTTVKDSGSFVVPPYEASSYQIKVFIPDTPFFNPPRKLIYKECPQKLVSSNCRTIEKTLSTSDEKNWINLGTYSRDTYVWVQLIVLSTPISDKGYKTEAQVTYEPYGLRRYGSLSGVKLLNANSCQVSITEAWYDRIINENLPGLDFDTSGNKNKEFLEPNEVTYYVEGFVTSPAPSIVLTYKGVDAWCQNGIIRQINKVNTANNIYYVASVDYSTELGREECCPGEKQGAYTCSNDYKWVLTENAECSLFKPCDGGDWAPDYGTEKQVARYSCVDGKCVKDTKKVECSHNSECASNEVCNINTWTCIATGEGTPLPESVPDNIGECEGRGGTWVTKETENYKWYNYIGIGEPAVVSESYCKFPMAWYYWVLIISLILLALIFIVPRILPLVRRVLPI